ncbi:hypothetical protein EDC96DRAFT_550410 [Choanephora cucurbitarum]|nr:hypothetical protein EDC96DRAFT_550410 [Choanephora cucurbitarum]
MSQLKRSLSLSCPLPCIWSKLPILSKVIAYSAIGNTRDPLVPLETLDLSYANFSPYTASLTLERAALLSSSNIRVKSVRCLQVVDYLFLLQDFLFLPFHDIDALVFWCYRYMTESIAKDTYSGKQSKTIQDYRKAIQDYCNGVLSLLGLYPDRDRWCSRLSRLSSAYDLRDTVCLWCSMLLVMYAFGDCYVSLGSMINQFSCCASLRY